MNMPLDLTWTDIALRLALTMLTGAIIGSNRGARGHAAGFRTTILVGLAASVAMILANGLLPLTGKTPESFATMDVMRLPLGILTGVGFIGGGTILKKGDLVSGVTTAATLWLMTVIGLCLGGGQLILGCVTTALAVVTLWLLKWVDLRIPREHRAVMVIAGNSDWSALRDLPCLLQPLHYRARFQQQRRIAGSDRAEYSFEISWKRPEQAAPPVDLIELIDRHYDLISFELTTENGR
jgi:putative Mg2+ transporter-C (MgtC) family protein